MARETGKQRSQRIQIDYYRQKTGLNRFRTFCVMAGLVGAGIYAAYVIASGGGSHLSTGPVALAHASFENDCQECHQGFTPMDSRGSKLDLKAIGLSSAASISHMESACQKCHQVGDHYRDTMSAEWQLEDQNCAGCHADHKGRDNDLTQVAMQKCTSCHADLKEGCLSEPRVRAEVVAFDEQQHGDFRSLLNGDPGTIKFDHHQHMRPGQVDDGSKGAFTLEMLEESLRGKYRKSGQSDTDPVQLDCSSCHQMAGNPDEGSTLIADNELGRYMKPVSFEEHCSACHSMNPGLATPDTTPLPHAVPWAKIDLLLSATIAGASASGQTRTPRDDTQTTPQPGEGLGQASSTVSSSALTAGVAAARKQVEAECLKCHDSNSITDEAITDSIEGTSPPMIPSRWLVHGLYDHGAHREIACAYCHDAAEGSSVGPPNDHETVMIGGIETCTGCHRDPEAPIPDSITSNALLGGQPTWASDNCTLCHRYHTPLGSSAGATP